MRASSVRTASCHCLGFAPCRILQVGSLLRQIRKSAAALGGLQVQCCIRGFPAIPDGFPVAGFGPGTNGVVNAISSFGFAFYM